MVINSFVSNGPLAQSVERGANNHNNGKVVFWRFIRTRFHFSLGLLSLFNPIPPGLFEGGAAWGGGGGGGMCPRPITLKLLMIMK